MAQVAGSSRENSPSSYDSNSPPTHSRRLVGSRRVTRRGYPLGGLGWLLAMPWLPPFSKIVGALIQLIRAASSWPM